MGCGAKALVCVGAAESRDGSSDGFPTKKAGIFAGLVFWRNEIDESVSRRATPVEVVVNARRDHVHI